MSRNIPEWLLRSPTLMRAAGVTPVAPRPTPKLPIQPLLRDDVKSSTAKRKSARKRQQRLLADKLCINSAKHGKATHGVRCKTCHDVHRGSRDMWKKKRKE